MDKKKSKLIKELKEFKKQNNIRQMYLFGSMASGSHHKDSDVDLILVSEKFRGKNVMQRSPPLHMKWRLKYPVDMLCYTPEEFNKLKRQITIVREAVRSGIKII